ncbi:ATP-binding protein [Halorubrum sp. DM2]|uniref:ATP-binding protein n=1 Tax=Halorubrum sp. DM2 TaxID=2527867 RepID=UPI0024B681A2|nr:ATP-binding protein [Halorubrum sp. DM2]
MTVTVGDERVLITVADEGPGFPEDERQVLANGKKEALVHGQGVGLYLAYWVVRSLDSEIEVSESQPGTTITVRLPAASSSPREQ